jgi:cobalt/nickel transport system permease protein
MKGESFLTRNIASFTGALESVILTEDLCRTRGLLQSLDPRVKVSSFVLLIVVVGLARSLWILAVIFAIVIILSFLAKLSLGFFLKRVFLFVPFTAIIAIPALFITPGQSLVDVAGKVIITLQGAHTAGFLILRVVDSISFGMLLILTTPWTNILVSLRWFRLPPVIVDILGMTYRYISLLLHSANSMFLARRSRTIGGFSGAENRSWLARSLATTMAKTQHLSEEVYLAMLSRGYQGEIYVINPLNFKFRDSIWAAAALIAAGLLLWGNYR